MAQTVYKELNDNYNGVTVKLSCGYDNDTLLKIYWSVETITGLNLPVTSKDYKTIKSQVFGSHQFNEADKRFKSQTRKYLK